MAKINFITVLNETMGLSPDDICRGIEKRSQRARLEPREVEIWLQDTDQVPDWVIRTAALWIMEYWMDERDACTAEQLLKIDEKYMRLFKDFTMGEIINMRNQLAREESVT